MRQTLLLALLAVTAYFYFQNSAAPTKPVVSVPPPAVVASAPVIVADTSSSYSHRWKTGPNAQTDFEPFLPNVQATWNQSSGCTIISGGRLRLR